MITLYKIKQFLKDKREMFECHYCRTYIKITTKKIKPVKVQRINSEVCDIGKGYVCPNCGKTNIIG